MICAGGSADHARVFNYKKNSTVLILDQHEDSICCTGWSFDGKYIASAGMDGRIFVYEVKSEIENLPEPPQALDPQLGVWLEGPDEVIWMNWHPNGYVLAAGANDGCVWMWHIPSKQVMHVLTGHGQPSVAGCFTADGKHLVSASSSPEVILWSPKDGKPVWKAEAGHPFAPDCPITALHCNEDSSVVIVGDEEGRVFFIQLISGKLIKAVHEQSSSIECITSSSASSSFSWSVSGSMDGKLIVWDNNTLSPRVKQTLSDGVNSALKISDYKVVCTTVDGYWLIADIRTGEVSEPIPLPDVPLCADYARGYLAIGDNIGGSTVYLVQ